METVTVEKKYQLCSSMKHYKVIEFPFQGVGFKNLTKDQAKIRFDWFVAAIPSRLQNLVDSIKTSGHQSTADRLDYSPESLFPLARWLSLHSHIRKKTAAEYQRSLEGISRPFLEDDPKEIVTDWTWTSETISLFFDVGIYFARVLQKQFKNVNWTFVTKPSKYIYVNKPILLGFKIHMSPSDLVQTSVIKMHQKRAGPEELKRIYDFWVTRMKDYLDEPKL